MNAQITRKLFFTILKKISLLLFLLHFNIEILINKDQ